MVARMRACTSYDTSYRSGTDWYGLMGYVLVWSGVLWFLTPRAQFSIFLRVLPCLTPTLGICYNACIWWDEPEPSTE